MYYHYQDAFCFPEMALYHLHTLAFNHRAQNRKHSTALPDLLFYSKVTHNFLWETQRQCFISSIHPLIMCPGNHLVINFTIIKAETEKYTGWAESKINRMLF